MMSYPTRTDVKPTPQARARAERVDALAGARNDASPDKQAVTRGDMAAQGAVRLLSTKVTTAPTVAEHNALVDDVRALAAALNAMGAKFTGL
jgi:hypothetical protein